jgi:DNA-binding transcriptional LysR family regulator
LANEGHFGRAADTLGVSQSALSRRIQALEQELGLPLFERSGRSANLTPAGLAFRKDAEKVMRDMRTAIRRAQLLSQGRLGNINIAANVDALRSPIVIKGIRKFSLMFPNVLLALQSLPEDAQLKALKRNDIDIGFLFDIAIDRATRPQLNLLKISESRTVLAMHREHPLASRDQIRMSDLQEQWITWPSNERGPAFVDALTAHFRRADVSPTIVVEVTTEETTLDLAAANLSMGFVQEGRWLPDGVLTRPIEDLNFKLALHAVWRRDSENIALQHLTEILLQRLKRRG